jgi:hypothetical protein
LSIGDWGRSHSTTRNPDANHGSAGEGMIDRVKRASRIEDEPCPAPSDPRENMVGATSAMATVCVFESPT